MTTMSEHPQIMAPLRIVGDITVEPRQVGSLRYHHAWSECGLENLAVPGCLKSSDPMEPLYVSTSGIVMKGFDLFKVLRARQDEKIKCGTGKLGADEYSSGEETRFVPRRCKLPACAECGAKRAVEWIRNQLCALPNIKWLGITMTMPYQLWPVFRDNQKLLAKLPALGAHAIDEWTRSHAVAVPFLITIMQTYNGELIFNPHLHIICSGGGMDTGKSKWIDNMGLEDAVESIMELWKAKVLDYLAQAYREGFVKKSVPKRFLKHLEWQRTRKWHHWIEARTKNDLLNYDGRYVGRPRDHKKIEKPVALDLRSFIKRITNHLPERYRHNVRYFGLLAPRLRRIAQTVIETNIPDSVAPEAANQATQRLWPPKDSQGNAMRRIRSVSPKEFERRQKSGRNR